MPDEVPQMLQGWTTGHRFPVPADSREQAFERLIFDAEPGHALQDGLIETPARAARAWAELTRGYREEPDLKTFPAEGDGIVAMRDLTFHSLCMHHLLPFYGTVAIAYLPKDKILGLSKFARLVDIYSRRLQIQERLTKQIASGLQRALTPKGIMVIVRASHACMSMRGVQRLGQTVITSEVTGAFRENAESRAEAMRLLDGG